MSKKKLLWILVLIIAIVAVVAIVIVMNNASQSQKDNADNNSVNLTSVNRTASENTVKDEEKKEVEYKKLELADGTLYTITGQKEKADIVIGTNFFDTTIVDMYYNPDNYLDKKIEIEGFYITNKDGTPYTFVARYSANALCPACPAGYSALEYQLQGKIDEKFKEEDTWIKVVGILDVGNDETSGYQDYYFLKVINLEVMNEKGEMTVNN